MKLIKRCTSVLLALVMMLAMSATAFAVDATNNEEYKAYKIFDASIVDLEKGQASYSIAANSAWLKDVKDYSGTGLTLTETADKTKYLVEVNSTFDATEFAAYLATKTTGKTVDGTRAKTSAETTITTSAGDGYYLITSSMGDICQLITGGTLTIEEKNTVPTIDKHANDGTASIGDTVTYTLTYTDGRGTTKKATITDALPNELTYVANSLSWNIKDGNSTNTVGDVVTSASESNGTITIEIDTSKLNENETVVFTYQAKVNENATANTAIKNTAHLNYSGQDDTSDSDVYTYDFNLFKYYTDATGKKVGLDLAEFKLENSEGTAISFVKTENGEYRVATSDDTTTTQTIVSTTGYVNIYGLAAGSYNLIETEAPKGYNQLTGKVPVTIKDDKENAVTQTVEVENKAGSTLPGTGGMGTTLLYTVGSVLVLGAGVLLVVRRRMDAAE